MNETATDPEAFYDAYGDAEWDRLKRGIDGRLEYEPTIAAIEETLPRSGTVLDAGGGAGRYAIWLAERGYEVTLADLSRTQLSIAKEKISTHGVADRVELVRKTVTDLGFDDETFDATLCLGGPISHLLDAADRRRAASELRRVTVSDGPVLVSVMGLFGFLQLQFVTGQHVGALPELLDTGDYDDALLEPHGYENQFTATHFFRRSELRSLLEAAGIEVSTIVGLEGFGSVYHDERTADRIEGLSVSEREAIVETIDRIRDDPVVADLSVHMLAVGSVRD